MPAPWAHSNPVLTAAAAAAPIAAMAAPAALSPATIAPPAISPTFCSASRSLSLSWAEAAASSPSSPTASPASSLLSAISPAPRAAFFMVFSASASVMFALSVSSPTSSCAWARVLSPSCVSSIWFLVPFIWTVALFRAIRSWSACLEFSPYSFFAFSSCALIRSTFSRCAS